MVVLLNNLTIREETSFDLLLKIPLNDLWSVYKSKDAIISASDLRFEHFCSKAPSGGLKYLIGRKKKQNFMLQKQKFFLFLVVCVRPKT